jgi:ABC-2 type transport system permease protein
MTGLLLRRYLWRDKWMILWWTVGATLLYYSQAVSVKGLYTTQAEFDRAAASMESNAAFIAMAGPARALNTVGGQVVWQATAFGAIVVGLMSMFLVGRHTRAEEESGRDELVRAAAVERHAPTTAALLVALVANVVVGALVALSLVSFPLAVEDSLAVGAGLTMCGWVFTATALLAAQLTSSTRATYGLAGAFIGLAYLLRAVGDVGDGVLSWLSPIGWYQAMHPFSGVRWWPALLLLGLAAAAVVAAYAVFARRDFGSGVLAVRPGPARAPAALRSGFGLAWRLHRGSLLGWTLGLAFVGLAYGSLGSDVGDLIGDSDASREIFTQGGAGLVDGFYATAMLTLALIASGYTVSAALRARGEEEAGRVEALLATGLPRRAWLTGHLVVTVVGTMVVLLTGGAAMGATYAATGGEGSAVTTYALGTAQYAAPALVLGAVAALLHALAPRLTVLAWVGLGLCVVLAFFGPLLQLPQLLLDVSPFEHLALMPAESFAPGAFAAVLGAATLLTAGAQMAFLRRDVH